MRADLALAKSLLELCPAGLCEPLVRGLDPRATDVIRGASRPGPMTTGAGGKLSLYSLLYSSLLSLQKTLRAGFRTPPSFSLAFRHTQRERGPRRSPAVTQLASLQCQINRPAAVGLAGPPHRGMAAARRRRPPAMGALLLLLLPRARARVQPVWDWWR